MGKAKSPEQRAVLADLAKSIQKRRGHRAKGVFARFLGVDPSTLAGWEEGRQAPGFDTAILIAKKLDLTLNELAFGRDEEAEKSKELALLLNQALEVIDRISKRRGQEEDR